MTAAPLEILSLEMIFLSLNWKGSKERKKYISYVFYILTPTAIYPLISKIHETEQEIVKIDLKYTKNESELAITKF